MEIVTELDNRRIEMIKFEHQREQTFFLNKRTQTQEFLNS